MNIKSKLTSRKFWLCTAAVLSSIGSTIAGICTQTSMLAISGVICCGVASGIYTVCEALIDAKAVSEG